MAPTLESLPAETFAVIVNDLKLSDIRALRLASVRLCHLATQDKFKSYCTSKNILLNEAGLSNFQLIAGKAPHLGAPLRSLTLKHPVNEDTRALPPPEGCRSGRTRAVARKVFNNPDIIREQQGLVRRLAARWDAPAQDASLYAEDGRFTELLSNAFNCLRASRPGYQLENLRLTIARPAPLEGEEGYGSDDDDDDADEESEYRSPQSFFGPPPAVVKTFTLALVALKTSQLPIVRLSLFRQTKYALVIDDFADHFCRSREREDTADSGDRDTFRTLLASLQQLTVHLTDPAATTLLTPVPNPGHSRNDRSATGLRCLRLDLSTNLRALDLQFSPLRTTQHASPPTISVYPVVDRQVGGLQPSNISHLRMLRLHTVSLQAVNFYRLLSECEATLTRLVLRHIELDSTADIVAGLFDLCTARATALEHFHFDYLSESDNPERQVLFTDHDITYGLARPGPPGSGFFGAGPRSGPELKRSGADIRKQIGFTLSGM